MFLVEISVLVFDKRNYVILPSFTLVANDSLSPRSLVLLIAEIYFGLQSCAPSRVFHVTFNASVC